MADQAASPADDIEERVENLLAEMTLAEKVQLLSGRDFWSLARIERLGIPSLSMTDGPTGLRSTNSDPATVFPVAVALASTWNRDLVRQTAAAIGREAIAHGVHVLLAPGVNIHRTPLGGRNFEYYSEDPHLAAEMGVAYVDGVQSEGVGTSLKHFVANNQEHLRMSGSSNLTERVLREIYLAAFEPVIKRANPWTVMCAYNRINGTFASEHDTLLNGVLKHEWGYDGVVVSDWGAVKSTIGAATGGLDLEMPGPAAHFGASLIKAVRDGDIQETTVNDQVRRVLRLISRCGLIDDPGRAKTPEAHGPHHRQLARQAAAESIVLLKNEDRILPQKSPASIAVIGTIADYPAIQGAGSSQVSAERIITPLQALQDALPEPTQIQFERGIDHEPKPPVIDRRRLSSGDNSQAAGLKVQYFESSDLSGPCVHEDYDGRLSKLGFGAAAQSEADQGFSAVWTGFFTPAYSGWHEWEISHSNPEIEFILDGENLINAQSERETELLFMILPLNVRRVRMKLEAGRAYPMTLRYFQPAEGAIAGFNILNVALREPAPERAAAITAASEADTAILFVGGGTTSETEGEDRASMALSDAQNALVEDVLAVNQNTIIVINSGGPIEMPWAARAKAIVHMWLPGQEGGGALSDILTGAINPSAKLPMTFPCRYADNPTFLHYPGGQNVDYGEGLFVGYRHYDKTKITPLFPFGHGLSYTRFDYHKLNTEIVQTDEVEVTVSLGITNSGSVAGAEIVQLYVEDLATQETMPVRQLRAFDKVNLAPGETKTLTLNLTKRAFAWWNTDLGDWTITPGRYRLHVGASSRDLRQMTEIELT